MGGGEDWYFKNFKEMFLIEVVFWGEVVVTFVVFIIFLWLLDFLSICLFVLF